MTRQYDNDGRDQTNIEQVQGNVTFNQTQIIQIAVAEIKTRPLNPTSPYRGLKPFGQLDKDYFFGRDQFLTGLVNELEQTNVILLLGASGSGKSSVVFAGLIPWLTQKWGSRLIDLILTPDRDPFEALYLSLGKHYKQSEAEMARAGNVDTLSQVVQTLKQPESFWLIFIDQFEELFTTSQPEKRDRFIQSLVQLSQEQSNDPSLKIVATMRADFLDRLDLHPANRLAKITDGHRPLMTQMHPDELRLAIEQPAAHHGVVFEAGLVETIIQDVQGQAGYLPLLQYTLNRLWEEELQTGDIQQERTLHTSTYWRLGGVRGALQQHVDAIYQRLQQEGNHLVTQRIFLKLVEIGGDAESGTDWKPVRRRANRSEFKDEQEKAVLAQLIDETLIVSDRDLPAQAQESTVEIAHEILLTSWTTLNLWIKENRRAIALRNRLNDDVARWQTNKTDDELWTGSKLEQVLELKKDSTFNQVLDGFSDTANQFIDASAGKRDRELRFYRRTAIGAVSALICIVALSMFSAFKWRAADKEQIEALSTSSMSAFNLNRNTLDGLLEALKAGTALQNSVWFRNDPELRANVMKALAANTYWVREQNRLQGHSNYVSSVSISQNTNSEEQLIATTSNDKTVKLWDSHGKLLKTIEGSSGFTSVSFSRDSKILATATLDGVFQLWNRDGNPLIPPQKHSSSSLWSVTFSPTGDLIATASEDGTVSVWNYQGQRLRTWQAHNRPIYSVAFHPDGQLLATASADATTKFWNLQGQSSGLPLRGHRKAVLRIKFSGDKRAIATASQDNTVILWDLKTRSVKRTLKGHTDSVTDVILDSGNNRIITASKDKTIKLWNPQGDLLETLEGHLDRINQVAFDRSTQTLISAGNDKIVKIWKLNYPYLTILTHQNKVRSMDISSDGKHIATGDIDNAIYLWDFAGNLRKRWQEDSAVYELNFGHNSNILAIAKGNGSISLSNLQGQLLHRLKKHKNLVTGASFSANDQIISSVDFDGLIKFWSSDGKPLSTLQGHNSIIYRVRFSPDNSTIATANDDGTVKLWNQNRTLRKVLLGHSAAVYNVSFSPNSEMIATASEDGTAKLWSRDGTLLKTLQGHTAGVLSVDFMPPDGQLIATSSDDETVKLWQPNGEMITTLVGHSSHINWLRFSPDGKTLATASGDRQAALWNVEDLTLNGLMKRGCNWSNDYQQSNVLRQLDNLCKN